MGKAEPSLTNFPTPRATLAYYARDYADVSPDLNSLFFRDDLLNLLADVEAGLDFAEEDISFAQPTALLGRLARGLAQLRRSLGSSL